jgi:hypothetical protein
MEDFCLDYLAFAPNGSLVEHARAKKIWMEHDTKKPHHSIHVSKIAGDKVIEKILIYERDFFIKNYNDIVDTLVECGYLEKEIGEG